MRWSYDDLMAFPADSLDILIEFIQERERKIEQAHRESARRRG